MARKTIHLETTKDFRDKIAHGLNGHLSYWTVGEINNLTATTSNICNFNTETVTYISSAGTYLRVVSDNGNNATAGTYARSVRVEGLNENGSYTNETIALEGVLGNTSTNTYRRVFNMYINSCGANAMSDDNIYLFNDGSTHTAAGVPTTTAETYLIVPTDTAMAVTARFTVPASSTGYITQVLLSADQVTNARPLEVVFERRANGSNMWEYKFAYEIPVNGTVEFDLLVPPEFDALDDIRLMVTGYSASAYHCHAAMQLYCVALNER